MKKLIYLIIPALMLVVSSFSGCESKAPNNLDNMELCKKWKLVAFVNESDGTNIPPQPNSPNNYWIEFNADNTLTGVSSTNDLSGGYQVITLDNQNLNIDIHAMTEINELGYGNLFIDNLNNVYKFSVTETVLKLFYSENDYLLFNVY